MYTQHFGQIPRYFTTWRHFCGETHTNTTCSLILIYKQAMYKTRIWCLSTLLNGSNLQQNIIAWEVGLSLDSNITAVDTHSGKHLIKSLPLSVRAGLCAAWFSPGRLSERHADSLRALGIHNLISPGPDAHNLSPTTTAESVYVAISSLADIYLHPHPLPWQRPKCLWKHFC